MSNDLKVVNLNMKQNDPHPLHHALLPNPRECFRLIIFSPSNSGKSNLIKNIISLDNFGYNRYYKTNIFLFSQTLTLDKIWTDLNIPTSNLYDHYDEELIKNIMHYSQKTSDGVLLILDDMITAETAFNNKKCNLLKTLFFQGRHYKVSLILVSQKLKEIPASMRVNASHLICFDLKNAKEERDFLEENCGIENVKEKYKVATAERFNFLYIDRNTGKAFHNFEQEL